MKTSRKILLLIALVAQCVVLLSCEEDEPEENCLSFSNVSESYFSFNGSNYDVSVNDLEDFVICSSNTIDAFWSANNTNEITFGFDRFNALSTISVDQSTGMPNFSLLMTQNTSLNNQKTYVAVAGEVSPCRGGYVFSVDMQELADASDLTSTRGNAIRLEGFVTCP
ncbi:hypothetical protein SAMN05192553_109141 [Cyclobacterium xiamenense]|uniref:Lipoprotein n=1 Tax=Cyclobacterium xiamenense TaxID=1297121 RepID=A0A1H7B4V4_9BACT|nr:hypothetical protein [Cyclobacterium xiamenense]SEJ72176.1 hypothetical protein SAMN05192553_109141 [Cyclobacterium xiamenense]